MKVTLADVSFFASQVFLATVQKLFSSIIGVAYQLYNGCPVNIEKLPSICRTLFPSLFCLLIIWKHSLFPLMFFICWLIFSLMFFFSTHIFSPYGHISCLLFSCFFYKGRGWIEAKDYISTTCGFGAST